MGEESEERREWKWWVWVEIVSRRRLRQWSQWHVASWVEVTVVMDGLVGRGVKREERECECELGVKM